MKKVFQFQPFNQYGNQSFQEIKSLLIRFGLLKLIFHYTLLGIENSSRIQRIQIVGDPVLPTLKKSCKSL